ncbi:TPA: acyltransferase family protein [Klebsiella pneumoniae]|nr:acyltransferase family protein [Klebsiella pneumoniae]
MNKLNYIHSIRGIAAFFIVLIHCNIFMSKEGMLNAFFYHFLTEWTAIFLLISGFLFQFLLPKYEFSSFMKKKITNVILPYIIVSIPAILIYLVIKPYIIGLTLVSCFQILNYIPFSIFI